MSPRTERGWPRAHSSICYPDMAHAYAVVVWRIYYSEAAFNRNRRPVQWLKPYNSVYSMSRLGAPVPRAPRSFVRVAASPELWF